MKLTATHIPIRPRSFTSLLDLSLHVFVRHGAAILALSLVGFLPFLLLDGYIGWRTYAGDRFDDPLEVLWILPVLVYLQAPLATAPVTVFLGRVMFLQPVTWWALMQEPLARLGTLLLVHGICRTTAFSTALAWMAAGGDDPTDTFVLLSMIALVALILRGMRPFVNELILLERAPLRRSPPSRSESLSRRNSSFHANNSGIIAGRSVASALATLIVSYSLHTGILSLLGLVVDLSALHPFYFLLLTSATLWFVATLFVVVRFLNYLDIRIRNEGWDVQIAVMSAVQEDDRRDIARAGPRHEVGISRTVRRLALAVCLCMASGIVRGGQNPGDWSPDTMRNVPWYDAQRDELRPVQPPSLREPRPLGSWTYTRKPSPTVPSNGSLLWQVISAIALTLLALFIIAIVTGMLFQTFGKWTGGQPVFKVPAVARLAQLPQHIPRTKRGLLEEARAAYDRGDLGWAAVYYYGYQLVELDRCGWIRLARGKTNRQYIRETHTYPMAQSLLKQTSRLSEAFYFGHHAPTSTQFETCWTQLEDFRHWTNAVHSSSPD